MPVVNPREGVLKNLFNDLDQLDRINPKAVNMIHLMIQLQLKKGHDYSGKQRDTLHNLRCSEDIGIAPWKGVLVRLSDKWRRICNYAVQGNFQVEDEDFDQTCADIANYAIFASILHSESPKSVAGSRDEDLVIIPPSHNIQNNRPGYPQDSAKDYLKSSGPVDKELF